MTTDPLILVHLNMEYQKFKIYIPTDFELIPIHTSSIRNNVLRDFTLIKLTVVRFMAAADIILTVIRNKHIANYRSSASIVKKHYSFNYEYKIRKLQSNHYRIVSTDYLITGRASLGVRGAPVEKHSFTDLSFWVLEPRWSVFTVRYGPNLQLQFKLIAVCKKRINLYVKNKEQNYNFSRCFVWV
jgi:hypothetical protein